MEDFVTIEIAKKLKEKGYNGRTDGRHVEKVPGTEREEWDDAEMMYVTVTNVVTTPRVRIWDALKWLREEKKIHIIIDISERGWFFNIRCLRTGYVIDGSLLGYSDSYEESAISCIDYIVDDLI